MPSLRRALSNRMVRYVVVGVAGYLLELAILFGAGALGWSNEVAVTLSYWIGLVASFALQKLVAFSNYEGGTKAAKQGASYLVLVGFNYVFTLAAVHLVGSHAPVWITRTVCLALSTAWNYLLYSTWIFKRRDEDHESASDAAGKED